MNDFKYLVLNLLLFGSIAIIVADTNLPLIDDMVELSGDRRLEAIRFFDECYDKVHDVNAPISTTNVIAAREEFVSGVAYVYNAKLTDGNSIKDYVIKIWDGPSTNIQINCFDNDPKINITF